MSEPKKVGTWVLACTPGGELIKWGKDGDTIYPFPPDDKDAIKTAMNLAHAHEEDRLYILHVFDNGQMKQYEFDPPGGVKMQFSFSLEGTCPFCGKILDQPGSVRGTGRHDLFVDDGVLHAAEQGSDLLLLDPDPHIYCNYCSGELHYDSYEES